MARKNYSERNAVCAANQIKNLRGIWLILILLILPLPLVNAAEEFEHYIFIIDKNAKVTYRYQYEIQVTNYGMYLPAFTTKLYVPSGVKNLKFFGV